MIYCNKSFSGSYFLEDSPLPIKGQRRLRGRENKVHDKGKKRKRRKG